jgi:hypothetical protein
MRPERIVLPVLIGDALKSLSEYAAGNSHSLVHKFKPCEAWLERMGDARGTIKMFLDAFLSS